MYRHGGASQARIGKLMGSDYAQQPAQTGTEMVEGEDGSVRPFRVNVPE
jgi:hypothetical protein